MKLSPPGSSPLLSAAKRGVPPDFASLNPGYKLHRIATNGKSRIHIAPVDGERLAGDEIALGGGEKNERSQKILWGFIALERA